MSWSLDNAALDPASDALGRLEQQHSMVQCKAISHMLLDTGLQEGTVLHRDAKYIYTGSDDDLVS